MCECINWIIVTVFVATAVVNTFTTHRRRCVESGSSWGSSKTWWHKLAFSLSCFSTSRSALFLVLLFFLFVCTTYSTHTVRRSFSSAVFDHRSSPSLLLRIRLAGCAGLYQHLFLFWSLYRGNWFTKLVSASYLHMCYFFIEAPLIEIDNSQTNAILIHTLMLHRKFYQWLIWKCYQVESILPIEIAKLR